MLSNMKTVHFENKKELLLGLRWRNVSGTKGSKGMLAVVKVKGMNGAGQESNWILLPWFQKFSIFVCNKWVTVIKIFPGIITKYITGSVTRDCVLS